MLQNEGIMKICCIYTNTNTKKLKQNIDSNAVSALHVCCVCMCIHIHTYIFMECLLNLKSIQKTKSKYKWVIRNWERRGQANRQTGDMQDKKIGERVY